LLKNLWRQPAVRHALILFVVLRLFLSGWAVLTQLVSPVPNTVDEVVRPYLHQPILNDGAAGLLLGPWQRFDALHYTRIAAEGYAHPEDSVFPPLRPWLMRTLGGLGNGSHAAHLAAGIVISNAALLALLITGAYSAWLFVGSLDALLTTLYGQALLFKLLLLAPVLLIAAINLVRTGQRLREGNERWTGILHNLVGAEIALIVVALIGAAIMTSVNPARVAAAMRQPPADNTFTQLDIQPDGAHVHFTVSPGWVGQNMFIVQLLADGTDPITDATLIRVRFDYLARNLGQSELRPTLTSDDQYVAEGANLSQPGEWRVRLTIQRPNQFDIVLDYPLTLELAPVPPDLNMGAPLPGHTRVELLAGAALMIVGGFTVGRKWLKLWDGVGVFGAAMLFVGIALVLTALGHPTL